jgi:hypothetical protein
MNMKKLYIGLAMFLTFTVFSQTSAAQVTNYYSTPDVITFNNIDYKFSWSSHPNTMYYKHEYLPKGDISDHFNNMLILDFVQGDFSIKEVVQLQLNKLIERKKTDAVCNYDMIESPDGKEVILDFLMSVSKDNKITLAEWNAYHYKFYTDKAGHKGVILFGLSHRAYEDSVDSFLKSLSAYRQHYRNALIAFPIPEIEIK